MARLSSTVLTKAHRFLLEISALNEHDQQRLIPERLARLIRCDRATLDSFDIAETREVHSIPAAPGHELGNNVEPEVRDYLNKLVLRHHSQGPGQHAVMFDAVRTNRPRKGSLIYHEYYLLAARGLHLAVIHFRRESSGGDRQGESAESDFTPADRALVELIGPHVVGAWRASRLRTEACAINRRDDAHQHAVVVDYETATVIALSSRAGSTLHMYFGEEVDEGCQLPLRLSRWMRAQPKQSEDRAEVRCQHQPFCIQVGGSSLTVRMMLTRPHLAVMLLTEISKSTRPGPSSIAACTPRENEVLHWMSQGKRNSEIATILDVSSRTIGKHLEHVFEKLGVETRSGAIHAAFESESSPRG